MTREHRDEERRLVTGVGGRAGEPWLEEEIVLALAACPATKQDYDETRPWVRELAELLGRSPGAVSRHFGNIFNLKLGKGHGLPNWGKLTAEVYERYRERPEDLARDAASIRKRLYEGSASPRVEALTTEDCAERLEEELRSRFAEGRLPFQSIILYRRRGSIWFGVLIAFQFALLYPDEVKELFRHVIQLLGTGAVRTPAVDLVLAQRQVDLADRALRVLSPRLHIDEFDGSDHISLALRFFELKSLRHWKPGSRPLTFQSPQGRDAEKARVGTFFAIDAKRACDTCLMMLLDAMREALTKAL